MDDKKFSLNNIVSVRNKNFGNAVWLLNKDSFYTNQYGNLVTNNFVMVKNTDGSFKYIGQDASEFIKSLFKLSVRNAEFTNLPDDETRELNWYDVMLFNQFLKTNGLKLNRKKGKLINEEEPKNRHHGNR